MPKCIWYEVGRNDEERNGTTFPIGHKCRECNGEDTECETYTTQEEAKNGFAHKWR